MESVKIGSVGLGRLGYEHAKNLAASIPGCVLHAICNVDTSRLRAVAEELGVPHTYTDFAAMCADPELDGIVIVSPSFLHVEQIKIAMEHGKHVFCEKPLGTNVARCWASCLTDFAS
ncbi:Gfo/Idh/MocA family oxidoreductase [Dysosmobacter welbionis]|mgnify:FL=1|uniref:Gfo/Idh/MocA family oxidoreductase n=1 Tax=Dysosmobacter welbionis TaxID=2093857 RepID=UPI003AB67853